MVARAERPEGDKDITGDGISSELGPFFTMSGAGKTGAGVGSCTGSDSPSDFFGGD